VACREWVKRQCGSVDLLGLQLKKGRALSLSAIYVPQMTGASLRRPHHAIAWTFLKLQQGKRLRHAPRSR